MQNETTNQYLYVSLTNPLPLYNTRFFCFNMLDPNDPRYEAILAERRTILQEPLRKERRDMWLEERLEEFHESDRLENGDDVVNVASLEEELRGMPDSIPNEALHEDIPKLGYAEDEPLFWSAFLDYFGGTQRKPGTKEKLALRFYSNPEIRKELRLMQSRSNDIRDILHKCIQELRGKFVLVDEHDNYALLRRDQLPKDVPSGGLYDLPLDAYLRQKGWDKGKAKRTHTRFAVHVRDEDASFLIRSESNEQDVVVRGYRVGILTVGSLVAFQQKYSIGYVYDLSDATMQNVLGMIRRDTRRANR